MPLLQQYESLILNIYFNNLSFQKDGEKPEQALTPKEPEPKVWVQFFHELVDMFSENG